MGVNVLILLMNILLLKTSIATNTSFDSDTECYNTTTLTDQLLHPAVSADQDVCNQLYQSQCGEYKMNFNDQFDTMRLLTGTGYLNSITETNIEVVKVMAKLLQSNNNETNLPLYETNLREHFDMCMDSTYDIQSFAEEAYQFIINTPFISQLVLHPEENLVSSFETAAYFYVEYGHEALFRVINYHQDESNVDTLFISPADVSDVFYQFPTQLMHHVNLLFSLEENKENNGFIPLESLHEAFEVLSKPSNAQQNYKICDLKSVKKDPICEALLPMLAIFNHKHEVAGSGRNLSKIHVYDLHHFAELNNLNRKTLGQAMAWSYILKIAKQVNIAHIPTVLNDTSKAAKCALQSISLDLYAATRLFIEKQLGWHTAGQIKTEAEQMFNNVKEAISTIFNNQKWLSPEAKHQLHTHLENIRPYIGYPEWLHDISIVNKCSKVSSANKTQL